MSGDFSSEDAEIPSEGKMPFNAEARRVELAGCVKELVRSAPGGSVKERIRTAARYLRLPFGRVQRYWYDEVRRIEAHEADQIRAYYNAAKKLVEARGEYERLCKDFLAETTDSTRSSPRPLPHDDVSTEAQAAAASAFLAAK